ncbi:MAG: aldo/keto reductase [Lachnospiraceae bacterium]|nr:aldo/keto reductase [Lachnospiraceae bacterium]
MSGTDFAAVTPKLGFGLMRLPKLSDGTIDIEQTKEMVDLFLNAGFTYFDTAYVYDNGASEEAARKALVERYPREKFTLATKMNAWLGKPDEESVKKQIDVSLERLGTDYIDYYLLHALQLNTRKFYERYRLWDHIRELKAKGKIKHWGFSFHATPEMLDELLTENPDAEFVQLQINYADWENANIASRACHEVARKHGKQIVVMEPVKGGMLANPPQEIVELFRQEAPEKSCASWALQFAAHQEGIITVLSGMSDIAQMKDNIASMKGFSKLSEHELEVIGRAQEIIAKSGAIPCTGCHYCTGGCPAHINIPDIFRAINTMRIYNDFEQAKRRYGFATMGRNAKAEACIACGQCEGACPQGLGIIELLKEGAELFDRAS